MPSDFIGRISGPTQRQRDLPPQIDAAQTATAASAEVEKRGALQSVEFYDMLSDFIG